MTQKITPRQAEALRAIVAQQKKTALRPKK
jgi:hypothetical protein